MTKRMSQYNPSEEVLVRKKGDSDEDQPGKEESVIVFEDKKHSF